MKCLGQRTTAKNLTGSSKIRNQFQNRYCCRYVADQFDVPELDTIYMNKPIQQHTDPNDLPCQPCLRRQREGVDCGLHRYQKNMNLALKKYTNFECDEFEGIEQAVTIVKDQLEVLAQMFHSFNSRDFFEGSPTEQLSCLNRAVEYVQLSGGTGNPVLWRRSSE